VRHRGGAAGAGGLLVGDSAGHEVAAELRACRREHLSSVHHRRDAALHVACASAEEPSLSHLGAVRMARPLSRGSRNHIDVAVEEQAAPVPATRDPRGELRASVEVETRWDDRARRHVVGRRLPHVHVGTDRAQPLRQVVLQGRLVARGVTDLACGRVEGDQVRGESHEVVAPCRDLFDDACLGCVDGTGHERNSRLLSVTTRIALAQLDVQLGELAANAQRARATLDDAAARGVELVVFSELQLSGYAVGSVRSDTTTAVAALPVIDGLPAALFGFHERNGRATHNSAAYVESGGVVHLQRKLRLVEYPPFRERAVFAPGDGLRAFDASIGRMATLICNDAWQPALASLAVADGARMLLIPAASPTVLPDVERYWRELTRFYAQMLECVVVFVNRVGNEAGLTFWGGSHVVDPFGQVVAEAPRFEEALLVVDVDLGQVAERRRAVPLVGDARLDVLRRELDRLEP
jgi:N-carbamoylputrescine amidase